MTSTMERNAYMTIRRSYGFVCGIIKTIIGYFDPHTHCLGVIFETNDHGVLKDGKERKLNLHKYDCVDFYYNKPIDVKTFISNVEKMTHNSVIISESSKYKGLKCINLSKIDLEMIMNNADTNLKQKIRLIIYHIYPISWWHKNEK